MDGSVFFVLGPVLVLAALVLSAIGIRGRGSFPPSRPVLIGLTLVFAAIVVGTTSLAVVNARDEKDHRDKELAEEEQAAGEEAAAEQPPGTPPAGGPPPPPAGGATTLAVTSPDDGSLVFEPDGLEAEPGTLTITYANPSVVQHSLAVEGGDGTILGETEIFTAGEQDVTLDGLAPGEYVFFCTVPGHREGGMEGDLLVE